MIDKASEADDGHELAEFLDRDHNEITIETTHSVGLGYDRPTALTLDANSLPDGWEINRVRWGASGECEVLLSDVKHPYHKDNDGTDAELEEEDDIEADTPTGKLFRGEYETDGGRSLDRTRDDRYE